MSEKRKLLFRFGEAADGLKYAFLTDQPDVEELFDSGYKVAYKTADESGKHVRLANWGKSYTVTSGEFELLTGQYQDDAVRAFDVMVEGLIKGIDVFFCDYNLGVEGDLPMCNNMMNKFRSTDFVLFSCADIVGNDPTVQPYMVSYAAPRYEQGQKIAQQHRVYCKTCHFAFCEAIHAVVTQRNHDNLCGGCVRSDLDAYIEAPVIAAPDAEQQLLYFVEALQDISSGKSNQGNTGTEIVVS